VASDDRPRIAIEERQLSLLEYKRTRDLSRDEVHVTRQAGGPTNSDLRTDLLAN
jgi:hypothetical protein